MKYNWKNTLIILFVLLSFPKVAWAARPVINYSADHKNIFINHKFFTPIAIWNPFIVNEGDLTTDERVYNRIKEVSERGFNVIFSNIGCSGNVIPLCKRVLDQAARYNQGKTDPNKQIWILFSVQNALYSNPNQSGIDLAKAIVGSVIEYPYFLGMLLGDEPDYSTGVPAAFLENANNQLHASYANFLTFIDLANASSATQYVKSADIIGHEHHCYLSRVICYSTFYLNELATDTIAFINNMNSLPLVQRKPAWAMIHSFGNYKDQKGVTQIAAPPTPDELKNIVNKWMAAGFTGFFYYTYASGNWAIAKSPPATWPNTTAVFGSPTLWNSFTALNNYIQSYINNRYTNPANCSCGTNNSCSNTCYFENYSNISYHYPLSCLRESSIHGSVPNVAEKSAYCKRNQRSVGDADGDNLINENDYGYYLRAILGGSLPAIANPDFNGDGKVTPTDLEIYSKAQRIQ